MDLRFESKSQSSQHLDMWCKKGLGILGLSKKLNQAGAKKAMTCVRLVSLMRQHQSLILLLLPGGVHSDIRRCGSNDYATFVWGG